MINLIHFYPENITAHIPYKIKNFQCNIMNLYGLGMDDVMDKFLSMFNYDEIKQNIDILITEYCKFGNARNFLGNNMSYFSDLDLKIFIFQFMSGFLHFNIIYQDLNIMIFIMRTFL